MKWKIHRDHARPQRWNGRVLRQRLDQLLPYPFCVFRLLGLDRDNIFIDEALFRKREAKGHAAITEVANGTAIVGQPQKSRPHQGEEPSRSTFRMVVDSSTWRSSASGQIATKEDPSKPCVGKRWGQALAARFIPSPSAGFTETSIATTLSKPSNSCGSRISACSK